MPSSSTNAEIVSMLQQELVGNYAIAAALTLATYEFVWGLRHEYAMFYKQKWNTATWLLLLNRYFTVINAIISISPASRTACNNIGANILLSFSFVPPAIAAIFLTLRVFALTNRGYMISFFALALSLASLGDKAYLSTKITYVYVDNSALGPSCYGISTLSGHSPLYHALLSSLAVIIVNLFAVIVTWKKTYRQARESDACNIRGVSSTLLRDGTVFIFPIFLMNLATFTLNLLPRFNRIESPVAAISGIMQPILITRFLVDLRRCPTVGADVNSTSVPRWSTLNISRQNVAVHDSNGSFDGPLDTQITADAWTGR